MKKKISISFSLLLTGAFLIVSIGIATIIFVSQFNSLQLMSSSLMLDSERKDFLIAELGKEVGYGGFIHHYKNYLLRNDKASRDNAIESYYRTDDLINSALEKNYLNPEEKRAVEVIQIKFLEYFQKINKIKTGYEQGLTVQNIDSLVAIDDTKAINAYGLLIESIKQNTISNSELLVSQVKKSAQKVVFVNILILGIAISLFFILFVTMNRQFKTVSFVSNALKNGDLSKLIELNTGDNFGRLVKNLNMAFANLRGLVQHTKQISSETINSISELDSEVEENLASITEISGNIDSINKLISNLEEEIFSSTSSIEEILANISSLSNQIDNQSAAVTQNSSALAEMSASIKNVSHIANVKKESTLALDNITKKGREKMTDMINIIGGIYHSIDKITELLEVIKSVSDSTNILSMNAAIEAAHAGESGKGFAVVADEISKLADLTSENTIMINETISSLIKNIESASDIAKENDTTFSSIELTISDFVNAFSEITNSTNELNVGSQEILSSSNTLMEISEQIRVGASEIKYGSDNISAGLGQIKEIASQTVHGMNEIKSGANAIVNSSQVISHTTKSSKEAFDDLNETLGSFKID